MLVLTRRTSERIEIGNNIRVTVVGVNGDQVKLGIDAPKELNIWRSELRNFRRSEKNKAEAI